VLATKLLLYLTPTLVDVASCGGMWNTYISMLSKAKDAEKAKADAAQASAGAGC
jgi:hypothetical protein